VTVKRYSLAGIHGATPPGWHEYVAVEDYEKVAAQVEVLRAALEISRGQWIHSVNAVQCLKALEA
jgi:hypothetical protein